MKHYCLKYVELDLQGQREVYLPEIMDIKGREVTTIIPTLNNSFDGSSRADYGSLFLNVIGVNGQKKITDNMPLSLIADDAEQGAFLPINRKIDLRNCFIFNPSQKNGKVLLVISYVNYDVVGGNVKNECYAAVDVAYREDFFNRFPDIERLRNVLFTGIELGDNTLTLLNTDVFTAEAKNLFLTLQKGEVKVIDRVPFTLFAQKRYFEKIRFAPIAIDLDNSFVEVGKTGNNGYYTLIFRHSEK